MPSLKTISAPILFALFALFARGAGAVPGEHPGDNAVLLWNEVLLQAVRDTKPGPTVVARAIAVLQTCVFDAWTAYDDGAVPTEPHRLWRRPAAERTDVRKAEAVTYAADTALHDLFPTEGALFDVLLAEQGYPAVPPSLDLRPRPESGSPRPGRCSIFATTTDRISWVISPPARTRTTRDTRR